MRMVAIVTFVLAGLVSHLSAQSTAQQVASAFTKHKDVVKEKNGVRMEKYKDVHSEPTLRQRVQDYAGVYEVPDMGYRITIQVGTDGTISAYRDNSKLENARIDGAVLTAKGFEGVFLTRTDRDSPSDPGTVMYGLGVVLRTPIEFNGNTYDKLFYQLKQ